MELIVENGKTFLKGIMTEANYGKNENGVDFSFRGRNRNGRLYPYEILKEAVLKLKERVENSGVLAYRNHPPHSNLVYEDSCSKIVELEWVNESGRAHCKVEILEGTSYGMQVLNDIAKGIQYGISTRALGSLDENKIVQPGLNLVTADLIPIIEENGYFISQQSCQSCELSLHESIQEFYTDYLIEENKSCECVFSELTEIEQKIVHKYTINKLFEGI